MSKNLQNGVPLLYNVIMPHARHWLHFALLRAKQPVKIWNDCCGYSPITYARPGQESSLRPFPTRVSWNQCLACYTTWWPSYASKALESARALVWWFPYATTWEGYSIRCLMDLPSMDREQWAGVMVLSCICCVTKWATCSLLPNFYASSG